MPLVIDYKPVVKQKAITWFIGIGIDQFADKRYNLDYSSKDIKDLAVNLKNKFGPDVRIDTIFNKNVTVSNIKKLKEKLKSTGINDKVILAYSGHGLLSRDFDYFLSTYSIDFQNPEINGLPYGDLENLMDGIPARKKLILIDACHSGEIDKEEFTRQAGMADSLGLSNGKGLIVEGPKNNLGLRRSFELMQSLFVNVSKSTGSTVISAAAGTQFALERNDLKNGVFTFCILEAFRKYSTVKVSELKNHVIKRVDQLTKGMQVPTARSEMISNDWTLW